MSQNGQGPFSINASGEHVQLEFEQDQLGVNDLENHAFSVSTKSELHNYIISTVSLWKSYALTYYYTSNKWGLLVNVLTMTQIITNSLVLIGNSSFPYWTYVTSALAGLNLLLIGINSRFQPSQKQSENQTAGDEYKKLSVWAKGITLIMNDLTTESLFSKFNVIQSSVKELTDKYTEPEPRLIAYYRKEIQDGVIDIC